MAAGVHHPRDGGGETNRSFLQDWQRVHVPAQDHAASRPGTLDDADDAGLANAGAMRDAERCEARRDASCSLDLLVGEFGVLMDRSAVFNQLRFQVAGVLEKVCG